ncbi:MAG: hypothetical protein JOZ05_08305, partial [Acetobacteraceae bacterium]|nr:hypothetical protein [Acetobacteraceae bacterium]
MLKPSRYALLILSLAACGASDIGLESGERVSTYKPSGAFADFLTGRFAASRNDLGTAAEKLESALSEDPGVPELAMQAFLAATLAGRPDAPRLAASLPDNAIAQLVLADREANLGHWDRAEVGFGALSQQQPLTQVLRPLLIAWSQQGQGRTDAALGTLAPLIEGTRFRGVYALHAALMADLGGQAAEAARLYRVAATEYGPLNLRLGVILASWQARQGNVAEAQRTIGDLAAGNGDLAIARQGFEANVSLPAVRNAADGIAEAYLAMAATLRQQGSDAAQLMVRFALDLRPDFTAARILLADIEDGQKRPAAALATLAEIPVSDPLAPVVSLRRAALLDETGQSEDATALLDELAR